MGSFFEDLAVLKGTHARRLISTRSWTYQRCRRATAFPDGGWTEAGGLSQLSTGGSGLLGGFV